MTAAGLIGGTLVDPGAADAGGEAPMPLAPDLVAVVVQQDGAGRLTVDSLTSGRATLRAQRGAGVWNFAPPGDLTSFEVGDEILAHGQWVDAQTFEATDISPMFEGVEETVDVVSGSNVSTASGLVVDISAARTSFDTAMASNRVHPPQGDVRGRTISAIVQRNVQTRRRRAYVVAFS